MIRYIPALVYSNQAVSGALETVRGYSHRVRVLIGWCPGERQKVLGRLH